MKKLFGLAVMLLTLGLTVSATPISLTVTTSSGMTTSVSGASVVTFDSLSTPFYASPYTENGVTYTGQYGIVSGDVSGQYRAPSGDATPYISVPSDQIDGGGSFDITFTGGTTYNYFGAYWGSLDAYNSITFWNGADSTTLTGTDLQNLTGVAFDCPPCGQAAASAYYNFLASTPFDRITVSSTQKALESDNHAFATVPEPSSMMLLGTGIFGVFGIVRRKLGR
jgi:hypothetical protein